MEQEREIYAFDHILVYQLQILDLNNVAVYTDPDKTDEKEKLTMVGYYAYLCGY